MNTRLSQRVYTEAALEFWLERLGGDWEGKFSEAELTAGRRLYRQGAVRQLELGATDAIVHVRLEGAEEAYVVLDWETPELSIRASVDDVRQRRLLAVVGLYEVEELVGDEAPALEPDIRQPAKEDTATDSAHEGTEDDAPAPTSVPEGTGSTADTDKKESRDGGSSAAAVEKAPSANAGDAADGSARASAEGSSTEGDAGPATSAKAPQDAVPAGEAASAQAPAEHRLELHFSLRQGALLFRAGWRQKGRRRLLPALGEAAPSAETMTAGERETLIRLASLARRSGFRYDKAQGAYQLDDVERMEQFVGKELGGWSEFFEVTQETDVALLVRGVQEVSLRARISESDEGSLSLHWMAGFEQDLPGRERLPAFTAAERRRLLRAGASPLLLPGRGLVRLSEKQARASERLSDAVSLFPGGAAPRYLLFSLVGLSDLPVEVSASLQRWRQGVVGGTLEPKAKKSRPKAVAAQKNETVVSSGEPTAPSGEAAAQASGSTAASSGSVVQSGERTAAPRGATVPSGELAASSGATVPSGGATASSGEPAASSSRATAQAEASLGQAEATVALPEFLRPYQRLGVGWMRHLFERGCHGLLADEMGLGKTVQVLSLIATFDCGGKPSLVVCPASVVPVWQAQAAQFFPHLRVRVLGAGCTFATENEEPTDLWLASYTQLRRHKPLLDQVQFGRAALDEAQFIKNPEAKVTQACLSIRAEHRLALTGTPLENRYLDVWTLFRFLMPGLLGTRRRFEEALATDEAKHLVTLRKQLAPFILRRTKSEVASELPEKVELDLVCPLTDMQRTEYRRLLSEGIALYEGRGTGKQGTVGSQPSMVTADAQQEAASTPQSLTEQVAVPENREATASVAKQEQMSTGAQAAADLSKAHATAAAGQPGVMSVLSLLTRLRQVACDPALLPWMQEAGLHHSGKLNLLRDRLGEVFANGKKAVVFSQFVKFLDRARQAIAADYPAIPIYQLVGTTRDRTRPVERFQAQEGAGVMLVSLKAGGTGITLHAADYVFLLDPWWNPAVEAQAIDRVHRIGQLNRVFVYRMVTAETVEARIAALKQTKRERFEQIVSGASGGDDFREAFRSLESLLGLLRTSDAPEAESTLPETTPVSSEAEGASEEADAMPLEVESRS